MIVADTNILVYLFLESPFTERARDLSRADPAWAAPLVWRSEFRNVMALYLRKRFFRCEDALNAQAKAEDFMRGREFSVNSEEVLSLVNTTSCSAYDCEFVAVARSLQVRLVTMDKAILRAFPNEAIALDAE